MVFAVTAIVMGLLWIIAYGEIVWDVTHAY